MLSLLLLSLTTWGGAAWYENTFTIHNATELIKFASNFSYGNTYRGSTVVLDSDIVFTEELSQEFEPIGWNYSFEGTFDGQGYTISNLTIESRFQYVGLFGKSSGTIRNIVMDDTCSVTSPYESNSTDNVFIGGIIGKHTTRNIENCVNMASVTFNGNLSGGNLYIGGIVGAADYYYYGTCYYYLINCVNYGHVKDLGGTKTSYGGGIGGFIDSFNVYNSINYGSITYEWISSTREIGGIAGYSYDSVFENCVSATESITVGFINDYTYIGAIGGVFSSPIMKNCYWSENIPFNRFGWINGRYSLWNISKFNDNFELNETVSYGEYTGTSLIEALNADYNHILLDFSPWVLNKGEKEMSFTLNNEKRSFTYKSKIILLPSLANSGILLFNGWYTNSGFTTPFTKNEIDVVTEVYGKWREDTRIHKITYDMRGGGKNDMVMSQLGMTVYLPSPKRKYCKLVRWETDNGEVIKQDVFPMPARSFTLHAVWLCTHLTNAYDFINFANYIETGKKYEEPTVFLDSDIEFTDELSREFKPIGTRYFYQGTFDGQGYAIRNLAINTSQDRAGLFAESNGKTIVRNIVLDESCSITSSYIQGSYNGGGIGGIIGWSYSYYDNIIENCVNMASLTFNGNTDNNVFIGGIVGSFSIIESNFTIKNCANFGSISYIGKSPNSYIGGIGGEIAGYSSIYNCLNHGTITQNIISYENMIGGIIGYGSNNIIENCVSDGIITCGESNKYTYIGAIAGYVRSPTMSNCYWNENTQFDRLGGIKGDHSISNIAKFNDNFEFNENVSAVKYTGTSLIEALNTVVDCRILDGYSHWTLNKEEKEMLFTLNNETRSYTYNSKIILLPSLANSGNLWFDGWYTDSACTMPFTKNEIDVATELYGNFEENYKTYTISLDTRGGDPLDPITAQFSSVVELPTPTRKDCYFIRWETEYGDKVKKNFQMPAKNFTLRSFYLCKRLATPDDFIDFTRIIKGWSSFLGTTVFLDADVDFSGIEFEPIGTRSNIKIVHFLGTFDGQGHVIRNLNINSTSRYVGLFGYSDGMTVRNLVLDESCSISSYSQSNSGHFYMGGFIGQCYMYNLGCNIENCVNKASVTFTGNYSGNGGGTFIGGIVGEISWYRHITSYLKNCVNYGVITHSGESFSAYIGGIAGKASGVYVQDCINYGNVTFNGIITKEFLVSGIVGNTETTSITNCTNEGIITPSGATTLSFGLAWVLLVLLLL